MGHSNPFLYTPKQLSAFSRLASKRKKADLLEQLLILRVSHHAKTEDFKKVERDLRSGK